ncbi:MAG: biosynthetic peptidoglycan transglycosylase [Clostridia bacterium]
MIFLKVILILVAAVLLCCIGVAGYALALLIRRPPLRLYRERSAQPDFIPLSRIPKRLIDLLVYLEDKNFHDHPGYSLKMIRYVWNGNRKAGRIIAGASTITQQLAKNLYFRFNHSYIRKAAELLVSLVLERRLGKDRILEMYLNIIYFGNGVYGITGAARFYFDKPVAGLSLNQTLMIAVIPAAPTRGNPIQHPETYERLRDSRLKKLTAVEPPLVSPEEDAAIRAFGPDCLDPELRKNDEFTRAYPQDIPLINERFGPYAK